MNTGGDLRPEVANQIVEVRESVKLEREMRLLSIANIPPKELTNSVSMVDQCIAKNWNS